MTTGLVFDIRRFSIHDGPGIRTTVFFKGCPLACWWCHNPEGQSFAAELVFHPNRCIQSGECVAACPQAAISIHNSRPITDRNVCALCGACVEACAADARQIAGQEMAVEEVMGEIMADLPFYEQSGGGVTFSGGEPLSQPEFLIELLSACRVYGLHTALDTSGYASWDILNQVRDDIDLFLYDLKLVDEQQHLHYTGVSNDLILRNLERLSQEGHRIVIRVPVIPGITDSLENIAAIGAFASGLPGMQRIDLLPYHSITEGKYTRLDKKYPLTGMKPPPDDHLYALQRTLEEFGYAVTIGG